MRSGGSIGFLPVALLALCGPPLDACKGPPVGSIEEAAGGSGGSRDSGSGAESTRDAGIPIGGNSANAANAGGTIGPDGANALGPSDAAGLAGAIGIGGAMGIGGVTDGGSGSEIGPGGAAGASGASATVGGGSGRGGEGQGGATSAGGSVGTGGASGTGGTQSTGGGAGTGGAPGSGGTGSECTAPSTRGDCADGGQMCKAGTFVPDRACYRDLCEIVSYDSTDSTPPAKCEGWGRVAVNAAGWVVDDSMVTGFGVKDTQVEASFQFKGPNDIGSISLYLTPSLPWGAIRSVHVEATKYGSPDPILEISFELQGSNLGGVAQLRYLGGDSFETWPTLNQTSSYGDGGISYFAVGGYPDRVDLINLRLRPRGWAASDTGSATLQVHGIVISY